MHIGIILPHTPGHLNPGTTLGQALQERGHKVTIISLALVKFRVERSGLNFAPIGVDEAEKIASDLDILGQLNGIQALKQTIQIGADITSILYRDLPTIFKTHQLDALLIDEAAMEAASVAEFHKIRFGILCNALPMLRDPVSPPFMTPWHPTTNMLLARWRNNMTWLVVDWLLKPIRVQDKAYRRDHKLPAWTIERRREAGLFRMAQCPSCFDFPRECLPDHFFYTSPWHHHNHDNKSRDRGDGSNSSSTSSFPWEKLDQTKKLVYASMGTLQNRVEEIYLNLMEACQEMDDVQLVVALGRPGATLRHYNHNNNTNNNSTNVLVVDYAPQLRLLKRASALVTHAGQNTALEGLSCGLPMVAIPVANDQPAVAARLQYWGVAEVVPPGRATPAALRRALQSVLSDPSYQEASMKLCKRMVQHGPTLEQVAEAVEVGLGTRLEEEGRFRRTSEEAIRILGEPMHNELPVVVQSSVHWKTPVVVAAVGLLAGWFLTLTFPSMQAQ